MHRTDVHVIEGLAHDCVLRWTTIFKWHYSLRLMAFPMVMSASACMRGSRHAFAWQHLLTAKRILMTVDTNLRQRIV